MIYASPSCRAYRWSKTAPTTSSATHGSSCASGAGCSTTTVSWSPTGCPWEGSTPAAASKGRAGCRVGRRHASPTAVTARTRTSSTPTTSSSRAPCAASPSAPGTCPGENEDRAGNEAAKSCRTTSDKSSCNAKLEGPCAPRLNLVPLLLLVVVLLMPEPDRLRESWLRQLVAQVLQIALVKTN